MSGQFQHADALREYLTGVGTDGGAQADPTLSLGHFRSSTEALSTSVLVTNPLANVTILYAGGGNPLGDGALIAPNTSQLTWKPPGASANGLPVQFTGAGDIQIVEGLDTPGQYLRVQGTVPFTPGQEIVTLDAVMDSVFALGDVSAANALAGVSEYRATIVRNESGKPVSGFQRWLDLLGTPQVSDAGFLGAAGSGTIITSGSFADWPVAGWCRVQTSGGSLREIVYYSSRTLTALTVSAAGRARFASTAAAGLASDNVYPVPGIALAVDTAGVQTQGSSIQTIASGTTAPTAVSWNTGITAATGLQIGSLGVAQQVGLWLWRQMPVGSRATPRALVSILESFSAF